MITGSVNELNNLFNQLMEKSMVFFELELLIYILLRFTLLKMVMDEWHGR